MLYVNLLVYRKNILNISWKVVSVMTLYIHGMKRKSLYYVLNMVIKYLCIYKYRELCYCYFTKTELTSKIFLDILCNTF